MEDEDGEEEPESPMKLQRDESQSATYNSDSNLMS